MAQEFTVDDLFADIYLEEIDMRAKLALNHTKVKEVRIALTKILREVAVARLAFMEVTGFCAEEIEGA